MELIPAKENRWLWIGAAALIVLLGVVFFMNGGSMPGGSDEKQLSPEEELQMKHQVLKSLRAAPSASGINAEGSVEAAVEEGLTAAKKLKVLESLRGQ